MSLTPKEENQLIINFCEQHKQKPDQKSAICLVYSRSCLLSGLIEPYIELKNIFVVHADDDKEANIICKENEIDNFIIV